MPKHAIWLAIAVSALFFLPRPAAATTNKTLGTYPVSAYGGTFANDVAISGNYAYIADDSNVLEIANIADYANPVHVRTIAMPSYMRRLVVSGNYLFTSDNDGLKIWSLTDPTNPSYLGVYTPSNLTISHIAVSGDYAYVSGISGSSEFHLQKIDITNPALPVMVFGADVNTGLNAGLAISGNQLFLTSGAVMKIYDIPSLAARGTYTNAVTGTEYQAVAAAGTKAYLNDAMYGFDVIDVTNPDAPVLAGHVDGRYSRGLALSGDYALAANNIVGHLTVINIATTPASIVDTYSGAFDGLTVVVKGTTAIMANGAGGLRFFDISNPVVVTDPASSNPSSAPVVTLSGSTLIVKSAGDKYTEAGYTATDIIDGSITANVVRSGALNMNKVGVYPLTYTVTNSRQVSGTATRLVVVQPKLTSLKPKAGRYTITVNKKTVRLKPYASMPASILAYKAVLTTTTAPYYVFLNPNAKKPELVIYTSTGKAWKRYDLSKISKVGLNVKLAVDPATLAVLVAATSKKTGPSVTLYKLSSTGLAKLGTVKASTKKTPVVIALLRTNPFMTELVTYVKGAAKPLVWYYHPLTKKMTQDKTYDTKLLKWTSSKISLR